MGPDAIELGELVRGEVQKEPYAEVVEALMLSGGWIVRRMVHKHQSDAHTIAITIAIEENALTFLEGRVSLCFHVRSLSSRSCPRRALE